MREAPRSAAKARIERCDAGRTDPARHVFARPEEDIYGELHQDIDEVDLIPLVGEVPQRPADADRLQRGPDHCDHREGVPGKTEEEIEVGVWVACDCRDGKQRGG